MGLILVVDDNDMICNILKAALQRDGHKVIVAHDGDDGLQCFKRFPIELVVLDILMPNKEGLETIMEIRKAYTDLPVIAMSGGGSLGPYDFLDMARKLGATYSLRKPFGISELTELVGECLISAPSSIDGGVRRCASQ